MEQLFIFAAHYAKFVDHMKYLIVILSFFCLVSCTSDTPAGNSDAQTTSTTQSNQTSSGDLESPDISMQIQNMSTGDAFLIGTFSGRNFRVDSTGIDTNGNLRFKSSDPLIPGLYFIVLPDGSNFQLLMDKDQTMSIKTNAQDYTSTTVVEGNLDTKLLHENFKYERDYRAQLDPINAQLKTLAEGSAQHKALKQQQATIAAKRNEDLEKVFKQYPNSLYTVFKRAGQNPEVLDFVRADGTPDLGKQIYAYRTSFWDNVDFSDLRLLYTPVVSNKLNKYVHQLTTQDPDSIISSSDLLISKILDKPEYFKYVVNYIALAFDPTKSTMMDAEKVYVHMLQNYFTKERAVWADDATIQGLQQRAFEMAGSLTGLKGPDVSTTDVNGKEKSIYEMKSDYIVVYLYTPTCEHCQEQTPKLIDLYNRTKRSDLDVYSIAIDTNDKEWRDYVKKTAMPFTAVYDPTNRSIYAKYYVDVTPEVYVLNKERIIIGKNLKISQVEEVIRRDRER